MFSYIVAFLLGVFLAPAIRPLFRPILVEVIRAGLVVNDEVRRMSHTVREGVEDVQAEARAAQAPSAPAEASNEAPASAGDAPASDATSST
jgi:hypothetical protein